ncbi:MAG: hypothetical protein ACI915_004514 [Gammaproteobacteria bacterium]|jgi:hypothetical protein
MEIRNLSKNCREAALLVLAGALFVAPAIAEEVGECNSYQGKWFSYLGGSGQDWVERITADPAGNLITFGFSTSTDYPVQNAYQSTLNGGADAVITKFARSDDGGEVIFSTYLGGTGVEFGEDVKTGPNGMIYLTGNTSSPDFPTTPGAYQEQYGGGERDAFLVVMNPAGSEVLYSTFIGGAGDDRGRSIVIDEYGLIYIAGSTSSTDFPTTSGAYQTTFGGGSTDVFVLKINIHTSSLVYSTYLGGSGGDAEEDQNYPGRGLVSKGYVRLDVDPAQRPVVMFDTYSDDLPTDSTSVQEVFGGGLRDVFVFKLNNDASALVFSTYMGSDELEFAGGLRSNSEGATYFTMTSENAPFLEDITHPISGVNYDGFVGFGGRDGYIIALDPAGLLRIYTRIGLRNTETFRNMTIDESGRIYVTGVWRDELFLNGELKLDAKENYDPLILVLDPQAQQILWGTRFGGGEDGIGYGIALTAPGRIYLAGLTLSRDFPVTPGAYQTFAGEGLYDGWVGALDPCPEIPVAGATALDSSFSRVAAMSAYSPPLLAFGSRAPR